jgi:hypothetical protein
VADRHALVDVTQGESVPISAHSKPGRRPSAHEAIRDLEGGDTSGDGARAARAREPFQHLGQMEPHRDALTI